MRQSAQINFGAWLDAAKAHLGGGMKKQKLIKEIEKHKNAIAKHRDALREIYEEIETDLDAFDRGIDYLQCAIDDISEVV